MQTLLTNARILDPASFDKDWPGLIEGHILIEDGIVRDHHARPVAAPDRRTIDLRGRTVLPGLIDCHVHVVAHQMNLAANGQVPDALAVFRSLPILRGMLDRGFTTVRDVGGAPYALAQAIEEGHAPGPRLVVCGKALSKTGGHTDLRPRHDITDPHRWSSHFGALGRVADGPDEIRRACRQELRQGAHFIKIMANGGIASPTDPIAWHGYSEEEMHTAVQEAQDAQTYVSAHLYTPAAIARAVRAGVHSLEHCNRIDAETAQQAAAAGCVAVPTLVTYEALAEDGLRFGFPPDSIAKIDSVRSAGIESLSILHQAGVIMAFGTDLLGETHIRQNEEFAIRARVLPARDILAAATTIAARLLRMEGKIGTLAPGAHADLLVVDGDPSVDIALLAQPDRHIRLVMKGGVVHRSSLV